MNEQGSQPPTLEEILRETERLAIAVRERFNTVDYLNLHVETKGEFHKGYYGDFTVRLEGLGEVRTYTSHARNVRFGLYCRCGSESALYLYKNGRAPRIGKKPRGETPEEHYTKVNEVLRWALNLKVVNDA